MSSPVEAAVRAAASLELQRTPEETIQQVRLIIADTLGVIRAGSRLSETTALRKIYREQGLLVEEHQPGLSTVMTANKALYAHPELAAYLNGTAGTFLELDEGMRPTGHAGIHVVPAVIAAAESVGASGHSVLEAVLSGYEAVSRLFVGIALNYPIHPHGHLGGIGAAVGVARIRGTDPVEAAAIAATTPVFSIWDPCFEGATARNSWPGIAAQNGVRAQSLAEAGFKGSFRNLEGAFAELVGSYRDEEALRAPIDYGALGVQQNYFKFHSCCALNHAAVEAVEQMMGSLSIDEIDSIEIDTVQNNMKLDRQAQPNNLSSRFSLQYAVAARLLANESEIATFDYDPKVAAFAEKISVHNTDDLQELWPHSSPARLRVKIKDGSVQESRVDNPRGHFKNPPGPDDLREKFVALWKDADAAEIWGELMALGEKSSLSTLFERG